MKLLTCLNLGASLITFGTIISSMLIIGVLFSPLACAGGHEECELCHKDAAREDYTLIVQPDTETINPRTGRLFGIRDALCMSCHREKLDLDATHSVGVIPQKAVMPKDALGFRGQELELTCESCHDPHPDNENYMYLRWPASPEKGGLNQFCATCHPRQANDRR
jgi:hypothetical protein